MLLLERSGSLDTKTQELIEREKNISEKTENQNLFAEKVWKGYIALKLVSQEDKREILLEKDIQIKLKTIEGEYDEKIKLATNDDERRNISEKFIADIMTLLTNRWNTICEYKNLWRSRQYYFREEEIELINNEYPKFLNEDIGDFSIRKHLESIFAKHKQLIEEQEKLISIQDEAINELEWIFDKRDNLLKMAAKLFEL